MLVEDEVEVNVSSVLVTVMALVMAMNVSSVLAMALVMVMNVANVLVMALVMVMANVLVEHRSRRV